MENLKKNIFHVGELDSSKYAELHLFPTWHKADSKTDIFLGSFRNFYGELLQRKLASESILEIGCMDDFWSTLFEKAILFVCTPKKLKPVDCVWLV